MTKEPNLPWVYFIYGAKKNTSLRSLRYYLIGYACANGTGTKPNTVRESPHWNGRTHHGLRIRTADEFPDYVKNDLEEEGFTIILDGWP